MESALRRVRGKFLLPVGEGGKRSEKGEVGSDLTLSPYPLSLQLSSKILEVLVRQARNVK